jgi:hypothetical protein
MSLHQTEEEKQLATIDQPTKLNEAFDKSGIIWHDRAAALAKFREGREIVFEEGEPHVQFDSEILELSDALKRWAYDIRDPELFDGRSLPRTGVGLARPGIASKSDFPTIAEKVAYIQTHGEDSWARLPLTGIGASGEVKTFEDWKRLPSAEKIRRLNADPSVIQKLTKAGSTAGRSNVAYINHELIAKQQSIRGKR